MNCIDKGGFLQYVQGMNVRTHLAPTPSTAGPSEDPFPPSSYRDMQLLHELARTPEVTQRDLAKRMGIALGLTNGMLRRLNTRGYIKTLLVQKNKIHYVITPEGILEKGRLTGEFIRYSLHLYGGVRHFLREQMANLVEAGHRRIVLCGIDELAEIVCLTLQEMNLELVGVADDQPSQERFLGHPLHRLEEASRLECDRFLVVSLRRNDEPARQLRASGVGPERILFLSLPQLGDSSYPLHPSSRYLVPVVPSATDVVILCGGKGTRLGSLTARTPKPLLPVGKDPFLLRLISRMAEEGFTRFILAAHYLPEKFRGFLSAYNSRFPETHLVVEPQPLGTGGALRHAVIHVRSSTFIVANGDSWVSQPLAPVLEQHGKVGRAFTVVAVAASQVEGGALHKGVWKVGPRGEVVGFATDESVHDGWVNAGVYVMDRAMVASWPVGHYSLEENLPALLNGREAGVFCSQGRLLDIGTPAVYERAHRVLESVEGAAL